MAKWLIDDSMSSINTLKLSLVLLAGLIVSITNHTMAQSYTNSPGDTILSNANLDDVSVYNFIQTHPTFDTLFFKTYTQSVSMPPTWEASLCTSGNCFTSLVDSADFGPIMPGDDGLVSLHINPHFEAGTAIIRYLLFANNSPAQIDTLTWIITAGALSAPIQEYQKPTMYAAGEFLYVNHLDDRYTKLCIIDLNGKLICQYNLSTYQSPFYLPSLCTSHVIINLIGKNKTFKQKMYVH